MVQRFIIVFSLLVAVSITTAQAQDTDRVVEVGIISGRAIRSAAHTDVGVDGLSRLAQVINDLGADVQTISPESPIPAEVELVILIRPQRSLSARQTTILWEFMENGGHVLLAIDPYDHAEARTERASRGGIINLIDNRYGISVSDDFLIEPWFTIESLSDVLTSWSDASAEELLPHPVTQPLIDYNLPLRYWGGRQVLAQSYFGSVEISPLLYTENPHAEVTGIDYELNDTSQIEFTYNADTQGRMLIAALAENQNTGSRLALFGDSEMFQNIFGLTRSTTDESVPLFAGNHIFSQRIFAWMLGIPEAEWPSLPAEFTWLSLDGDLSEWQTFNTRSADIDLQAISSLQVFHNNHYMYTGIESTFELNESNAIELRGESGATPFIVELSANNVYFITDDDTILIPDASYQQSDAIESRIPLRIVGLNPIINQICTVSSGSRDCFELTLRSQQVNTIDPVPVRFENRPTAFLRSNGFLRVQANPNAEAITLLNAREQLAIIGRDDSGAWLYVANGAYQGWISTIVILTNADTSQLPVITETPN